MKITDRKNSPSFQMKRVDVDGKTIFNISDKMHRIEPKIMNLGGKSSVITAKPLADHRTTKISMHKEVINPRKSSIGKLIFGPQKIKKIRGASVEVPQNISEKNLKKTILKLISDSKKVWKNPKANDNAKRK